MLEFNLKLVLTSCKLNVENYKGSCQSLTIIVQVLCIYICAMYISLLLLASNICINLTQHSYIYFKFL